MNGRIIFNPKSGKYKRSFALQSEGILVRRKVPSSIKEVTQAEAIKLLGEDRYNTLTGPSKTRYIEALEKLKEKYNDFTKIPKSVYHYTLEYSSYPGDYPLSNLPRFMSIYDEFVNRKKREPTRDDIIDFLKYSRHPEYKLSEFLKAHYNI
jgi:F0F1-type ATP synthase gamma subunit